MTDQDEARIWDIVDRVRICMVATHDGGAIRARPMIALNDRDDGCIWFLSDARTHKEGEIRDDPRACVTFSAPDNGDYLALSGRIASTAERQRIAELWNPGADAWFPGGAGDPNVRALCFEPEQAEYWDEPGNQMVMKVELDRARQRGERPQIGAHGKVTLG